MNLIPEDIYTSHPEISKLLLSVSKHLRSVSLKGACNSLIDKNELVRYIDIEDYKIIGIACIYNNDELIMDIFVNDVIDGWIRFTSRKELSKNDTVELTKINYGNINPKDVSIHMKDDVSKTQLTDVYVDILNAHKIFTNRVSCQKIENYAKLLTKDYFDFMLKYLNNQFLYSYLFLNIIIFQMNNPDDILQEKYRPSENVESLISNIFYYIKNKL